MQRGMHYLRRVLLYKLRGKNRKLSGVRNLFALVLIVSNVGLLVMINKKIKWTRLEIKLIVQTLFESAQPSNEVIHCPREIKDFFKCMNGSPRQQKCCLVHCLEGGYDWDSKSAYMTTGVNGGQSAHFSTKDGDEMWGNADAITERIVSLSMNFEGWRVLRIEERNKAIYFYLYGGKTKWDTGCF